MKTGHFFSKSLLNSDALAVTCVGVNTKCSWIRRLFALL